jgi:hypothetical protein
LYCFQSTRRGHRADGSAAKLENLVGFVSATFQIDAVVETILTKVAAQDELDFTCLSPRGMRSCISTPHARGTCRRYRWSKRQYALVPIGYLIFELETATGL